MAASSESYLEPQQICDYVLLRHVNVGKDSENEKLYKRWTRLWVVVHTEVSPLDCFLGYCKKESKWLQDNQAIVKYPLSEFSVSMMSTKKHDKVMKLDFASLTVELSFDSQTKMDCFYKLLSGVSMRHYVDLVRAPSHADKEGDYIIEDCSESYKVWKSLDDRRGKLCWEWHLTTIRRIHYHKNVEKLEIETGRSSATGEGHFFFTGRHAFRLFEALKTELQARAQQKVQSQAKSLPSSHEPVKSKLYRSCSIASATKPPASNTQVQHAPQSSNSGGHKPLSTHLSHSNGALPPRSGRLLMDDSDTSSEEYSPSDNSSSFTGDTGGTGGTGGSIHDWTMSSPIPMGGLFDRPPHLPLRVSDTRPFSPCSTSSSSSSMSGFNIQRRSYQPALPSRHQQHPHYMPVNREEMDGEGDYMTMNPRHTKGQLSSEDTTDSGEAEEVEEYEEVVGEEENDSGYTDMHSAQTKSANFPENYMHMVPLGAGQTATLTRNRSEPLPPPLPPHTSSRFREIEVLESFQPPGTSNTFPGATRDGPSS